MGIHGEMLMQKWCVDSLDIPLQVELETFDIEYLYHYNYLHALASLL